VSAPVGAPDSARAPTSAEAPRAPLGALVAGLAFQNPIVLAAGTAGYGRELAGVMELDELGGIVTKAVSLAPRKGAPAPRVAEFTGGMINAVGLANPGLDEVRRDHLPWLAGQLRRARVVVNVVGNAVEDYAAVVAGLEGTPGAEAFELNVSCPNVKAGGMEFGADPVALRDVVSRARRETSRPLFVKLSPTLPDVAGSARVAVDAGADAITLVNTIPGLVIDVERRRPALGFGTGGVSGAGLLPVGVLATWKVSRAVSVPLLGLGGVSTAEHALQYVLAGASLVGIGTAAMQDPRVPERVVRDLARWCGRHGVRSLSELVGALEWPG
jgi:dihydroorotate dehydrogenase (NAD+) catalytic subunit